MFYRLLLRLQANTGKQINFLENIIKKVSIFSKYVFFPNKVRVNILLITKDTPLIKDETIMRPGGPCPLELLICFNSLLILKI